jgi:hypothetical protein
MDHFAARSRFVALPTTNQVESACLINALAGKLDTSAGVRLEAYETGLVDLGGRGRGFGAYFLKAKPIFCRLSRLKE